MSLRAFAAEGYVAIAPELFHRTAPPGFEGSYTDFPALMPHYQAVTNETAEADIRSAYEWLRSNAAGKGERDFERGILHGRAYSFIANSAVALRAAVSFYGGGIAPGLLDRVRSCSSIIIYMGRIGQAHHAGAAASRDRGFERGEENLRECRVLPRGSWILLR
jgi:dienelactone hydrolase